MGLQIPLEPAGDAEAESMEFILPSIRLVFSFHKICEENIVMLVGDLESVGYK